MLVMTFCDRSFINYGYNFMTRLSKVTAPMLHLAITKKMLGAFKRTT